ncbi:MAG: FtsX-like permease family protein [Brumimicrobium sp.]
MQLGVALLGALLGFSFLFVSVHYLVRINEFGKTESVLDNKAIVIQKKISTLTSLNLVKSDFSQDEILQLSQEDFIEDVEAVINNNFDVSLQTDSDLLPYVRSDIFLQSVDKNFLGIESLQWDWKESDAYVPMILPRDFLVMINSFTSAKGIPQISEDIAKNLGFKINISNDLKEETHKAKIFGFTSDISSILVPESFMKYANENYPISTVAETTQLILTVKKGKFGSFEKYMEQNMLESKDSAMMIGKLKSMMNILLSVITGVGALTLLLSGLIIVQYSQLIFSKNLYEIRTLMRIGYSPQKIIKVILKYLIYIFCMVLLASMVIFILSKLTLDNILMQNGIQIATSYTAMSFGIIILVFLLYIFANYSTLKKEVYKVR